MVLRCRYWIILIFLFSHKSGNAFQQIKYLGIEQGLSNNAVTCIFKDHYGFMWFGAYGGLNRHLWLPITFTGDDISINWLDTRDLNVFDKAKNR